MLEFLKWLVDGDSRPGAVKTLMPLSLGGIAATVLWGLVGGWLPYAIVGGLTAAWVGLGLIHWRGR